MHNIQSLLYIGSHVQNVFIYLLLLLFLWKPQFAADQPLRVTAKNKDNNYTCTVDVLHKDGVLRVLQTFNNISNDSIAFFCSFSSQ